MGSNNLPRSFRAQLDNLQKRAGYVFNDPALLLLAFTQRSSRGAQAPSANNERLEFLGDAALSLLVGEALYREYPEAGEGFMTIERSKLVCGPNLSAWGYEAGFDRMISAGDGVDVSDSMVEDSVEAVAGAFYLDGGLEAVKCFLQSFRDYPDQGSGFDSRRHLERDCSYEKLGTPHCETLPRRQKNRTVYESSITLDGKTVGAGIGTERDEAERHAAREAMMNLSRVSSDERRKRDAVLRARFRRVLARKSRLSSPGEPSMSDAESARRPAMVKDGVEYRLGGREGPEHKPVYTAAATRAGVQIASAKGPSKKAALKALVREVEKAEKARTSREEAAFRDVDLAALRGSPEVKGCLQTCCERLGLGQPHYTDLPPLGAKNPTFFVELSIGGEAVASGSGASKRAAGQAAAWKALQLLAADHVGLAETLNADAGQLASRLKAAFCAALEEDGEKNMRVDVQPVSGEEGTFRARVFCGQRMLTEVPGAGEAQAETFALVKSVTQARLWKGVLARLGMLKLCADCDNCRPDLAFEAYCRSKRLQAPEVIAMKDGGGEKVPFCRAGLFIDGALCAVVRAPGRKNAAQWLALLLLDRAARGLPLAPGVKKKPLRRPQKKHQQAQPSAPGAPAPAVETKTAAPAVSAPAAGTKPAAPDRSIGERLSDWWRRMGELYTRS